MNYRHAFHAGNFADVMKHALLVRILAYLQRKETPLRVIDTHAGIGLYDLSSDEARRTGEWGEGIGRLDTPFAPQVEAILAPYRAVVAAVRARHGPKAYPGSPAIVREMLRRQDQGVFVELHPKDHATLSERYNAVTNLKVLHLDAWIALHALIPPKEKRGLVLIDPPFEEPNEMQRLGDELLRAVAKWPTGTYAAWYPVKDLAPVDKVVKALDAALGRPALRLELYIDRPDDPARLNGSGLLVVNPPWTLRDEAETLLPALAERLSRGRYGAYRCTRFGAPD
ncbi:MAG TPA: 23S rRNA (adenine(2030)-N(6))-methyltransferase RlmJ [Microvirga sp.]|jgi:23S rRNA (adenine2030-N6)-methyltransferase|nr:23S rRNA (adenine(2030)-N(6))-methyltransferase RlmJ [Microvirga sp.]